MIDVINQMIAEQGEWWLASGADRTEPYQAVVITDSPRHCWRLTHGPAGWAIEESKLTAVKPYRCAKWKG